MYYCRVITVPSNGTRSSVGAVMNEFRCSLYMGLAIEGLISPSVCPTGGSRTEFPEKELVQPQNFSSAEMIISLYKTDITHIASK